MRSLNKYYIAALLLMPLAGCDKYLDNTKFPANALPGSEIYLLDNTTAAAVTSVFLRMNNTGLYTGSASSNFGYTSALYTDEARSILQGNFADTYYMDRIQSSNSPHWSDLYSKIFTINSVIEGINNTPATLTYKDQWLGEAFFLRAYCYFYLTNIYGDVPLALTTDYKINNVLSRAPQADVYKQIIADLKVAQTLLSDDYKNGNGATTANRARPNKAVATALLAKAYLFAGEWADAEAQATAVINNPAYKLEALSNVFLASSKETIWALYPNSPNRVPEYSFYNNGIPATLPAGQTPASFFVYSVLSNPLLLSFEPNDARAANWIKICNQPASGTTPAATYYLPAKYKASANNQEYEVLLRLADIYLIRAEARAHQEKQEAVADLNAVRSRAGLGGTSANDQGTLLAAIASERRHELFTECANRFFDLKRTGTIDAVMSAVAPQKGTTWSSYMQLWPIPPNDLAEDPNLTPNPGYLQ